MGPDYRGRRWAREGFAEELARQGFRLLLVSRTAAKLDELAVVLGQSGVEVRTLSLDLADSGPAPQEAIRAALQGLDLAVVVNCVGTTIHRRYAELPTESVRRLITVNVATTAIVTHIALPALLAHARQSGQRSAIIGVGSIVGRFYWRGTQLYGACKAFVDHLTVPLGHEYPAELDVLSFQPTVMATAMASGTEPAALTIAPAVAARAALAQLGHVASSHGHWRHALLAAAFAALPNRLRARLLLRTALEMAAVEQAQAG